MSETINVLTFVSTIVFIVPGLIYAETCNRLHWKGNVTVDSCFCSFENYTEPVPKGYCFKSCFNKQGVGVIKFSYHYINRSQYSNINFKHELKVFIESHCN